jgi:hypothetical protein
MTHRQDQQRIRIHHATKAVTLRAVLTRQQRRNRFGEKDVVVYVSNVSLYIL